MYKSVEPYVYCNPSESRKGHAQDIKLDLADICKQAHSTALLFRRTNIEYRWLQNAHNYAENNAYVDVVSTFGYETLHAASYRKEIKIMFGGVIKGGGASGSLKEEEILLRKSEVIVGPFDGRLMRSYD